LFVDRAPGTKLASTDTTSPYASGGGATTTAPAIDGAAVFATNCATCHGADARGRVGPNLVGIAKVIKDERVQILVVAQGSGGRMPAFGGRLSAAEIKAVVDYTR